MRILSILGVVLVIGAAVAAYFFVPLGTFELLDKAHAAVGAVQSQPGDPDDFMDRLKSHELDLASQERQAAGAAAFHHPPSGEMTRLVLLPPGMSDGATMARQICAQLEKDGVAREIDSQFPLVARTDSHSFKLQPVADSKGDTGILFTFEFTGFIRQGQPRRIADFGESLVRKEVNARCWMVSGFVTNPPHVPDVSPTAVATDLPDEPDTATAQAKLFHTSPAVFAQAASRPATAPLPSSSAEPAPAMPAAGVTAYAPPSAAPANPAPAGSDLKVRKVIMPENGILLNGLQYQTLDETKPTDLDKLLDQGQKDGAAANGGPLSQPAAQRIKLQEQTESPK